MPTTTYRVRGPRGETAEVTDTERAARLARAGYHVKAWTEGDA